MTNLLDNNRVIRNDSMWSPAKQDVVSGTSTALIAAAVSLTLARPDIHMIALSPVFPGPHGYVQTILYQERTLPDGLPDDD